MKALCKYTYYFRLYAFLSSIKTARIGAICYITLQKWYFSSSRYAQIQKREHGLFILTNIINRGEDMQVMYKKTAR